MGPAQWMVGVSDCQGAVTWRKLAGGSRRVVESRWCGWLTGDGFDDLGGDVAQLAVLMLGRAAQDGECLVVPAVLLGHQDPERLVDHRPGGQGRA
jgi:hypothetical protein